MLTITDLLAGTGLAESNLSQANKDRLRQIISAGTKAALDQLNAIIRAEAAKQSGTGTTTSTDQVVQDALAAQQAADQARLRSWLIWAGVALVAIVLAVWLWLRYFKKRK